MNYKPMSAVWKITMGCNMRCINCGTAYTSAYPDELSTIEAFRLCDQIGEMGFSRITLSGGEPTTHPDWDLIALRLYINGVKANMISNGWYIDESVALRAARANINTIAISIDGLEETHDEIRRSGSFERIMSAFAAIKKTQVHLSAVTRIHNRNISQLPELLRILEDNGVEGWQLQVDLPMGTVALNHGLNADQACVDAVNAFVHENLMKTNVDIQLTACIGSYRKIEFRQKDYIDFTHEWNGCGDVKVAVGILHNEKVFGGTSIQEREFIDRRLQARLQPEIWGDALSFSRNCQVANT